MSTANDNPVNTEIADAFAAANKTTKAAAAPNAPKTLSPPPAAASSAAAASSEAPAMRPGPNNTSTKKKRKLTHNDKHCATCRRSIKNPACIQFMALELYKINGKANTAVCQLVDSGQEKSLSVRPHICQHIGDKFFCSLQCLPSSNYKFKVYLRKLGIELPRFHPLNTAHLCTKCKSPLVARVVFDE